MLSRPRAVLMDFGGVIVEAPSQPPAPTELVDRVHGLIGGSMSADRIAKDFVQGARAYAAWRDKASDEAQPVELSHDQVWGDFIARQWPATARQAVRDEATSLSYAWSWQPGWAVRNGIAEALNTARTHGLPVAVVSNALCGAAHRDFIEQAGLSGEFVAEFYSDEAGVRKPNPELAWRAARAVDVAIGDCWFVGDSLGRDIACARRAGAGAAVLMRSARTAREGDSPGLTPDAVVDDGHGLRDLIVQACVT